MTTPSFITRLNWRLILLHFVACWFFAQGCMLLSYLLDLQLTHAIFNHPGDIVALSKFGAKRIEYLEIWSALGRPVGIILATGLSFTITIRKSWYWLNSFLAFVAASLLFAFRLSGWYQLNFVSLAPGRLLIKYFAGYFIVNGGILLLWGLLCLFLPAANRFIAARQKTATPAEIENLNPDNSVQA